MPCKSIASTPATAIPATNVGTVGFFQQMSAMTTGTGRSVKGLRSKLFSIVVRISR